MKKVICCLVLFITLFALISCAGTKNGIDYLVLVNKENKLPDDWEQNLETTTVKNSLGDDVEVEKEAYDAYLKLKAALEAEDVYVDLDSARRSVAEQQRIWDDFMKEYGEVYTKRTVATPGYSEHHTGLALDLYLIIDGEDVYLNEDMIEYTDVWAKIHAKLAEYGFILRYLEGKEDITGYGYEPWHIRYVGSTEIAKEITGKGITLEEYLNKLPVGNVAPSKDE
ncbi:MAG: M15 family metallopeptidase [Clostridia bacterium]|nr:M15 family metallopeptidase [Clostridia bacterium]